MFRPFPRGRARHPQLSPEFQRVFPALTSGFLSGGRGNLGLTEIRKRSQKMSMGRAERRAKQGGTEIANYRRGQGVMFCIMEKIAGTSFGASCRILTRLCGYSTWCLLPYGDLMVPLSV